jgi:hypothetical protein
MGAVTLSITTLSITTLSITTISFTIDYDSLVMLSAYLLSVTNNRPFVLSAVMQNVVILSVIAPFNWVYTLLL